MKLLGRVLKQMIGGNTSMRQLRVPKNRPLKKLTERELIQLESQIGARLFGDISVGGRREFFCLDATTWIWHEEWNHPQTKKREQMTIRYEVHDKGILKVQEGSRYSYIEGEELKNFMAAIDLYYEQVARNVYQRDPKTGLKLA